LLNELNQILGLGDESLLDLEEEAFKNIDPSKKEQLKKKLDLAGDEEVALGKVIAMLHPLYNPTQENLVYVVNQLMALNGLLKKIDPAGQSLILKFGNELNYYDNWPLDDSGKLIRLRYEPGAIVNFSPKVWPQK
jgi:hypothetical protein